ncbi:MAG: isoaspartyl peptidase/L-asparaginase [Flavobacteriales bacterium]|nr:isoaspartyl peptidase/L-asparaginase [Flavobacteriales bacterium]MBK6882322.1 isoaspartyl peptidase/L-asparaginase [Flavobacteriales bacterium]MBK7101459.1 isoaspartyl peptidase/L-asparaginase [Flavobacteriales bacterium]MBK7112167.1 isoaspartyl peptidase/L-asparaginase [Flavobacteriales bacterium]MBK7481827.1 isoaspartyl peptidase/L-asparaginase [Flavobacteriales bacterium]
MGNTALAIHGGAGTIAKELMTPLREKDHRAALELALQRGHAVLTKGGPALDAVETAVRALEDSPLFNAGKGSVFNADGQHEMDASLMNGSDLRAGAVAGVQNVKNPIGLARRVMDQSDHVFLSGNGAFEFAHKQKIELEDDEYFFDAFRYEQWKEVVGTDEVRLDHAGSSMEAKEKKFGTVGAVALDRAGHLAAATSTGGMTNKKWQRIGDSPIIGAGTYANDMTCAVSCTGHGESFIRAVAAFDVHAMMLYKGAALIEAVRVVIHEKLPPLDGDGGLIAIDRHGNIVMDFNCSGMYRGQVGPDGEFRTAIFR